MFDADPLRRMLQQHRYAAILAEKQRWQTHAEAGLIFAAASDALEQELALVPAGAVALAMSVDEAADETEREIDVTPFLMGVHAVTNERFQVFVDAGGYDELELWPKDIWPHLIEFVDQTGVPAPRYWREGRHDKRLRDHPVAGVSWYEAMAYARWAGLRLPTEVEWQMAASWRIRSQADLVRRFPWGDAMDRTRCNIWGAGLGETAPVDAFDSGAAPNNVLQLIGNVWEWTDSDFEIVDAEQRQVFGEMPMKSIRGGAFDTYFEVQASSSFRSGQIALGRTHNIGFRCAANAK
jgi:iron(II)-dependent oxidoreductase